jgi:hypothetical protein
MQMVNSKVENSAQVLSCLLKFVHAFGPEYRRSTKTNADISSYFYFEIYD